MSVIFTASTSLGAPQNTSLFVVPFLLWINPHMSPGQIEFWHHIIRKTAHVTEYGILGIFIWRVIHSSPSLALESRGRQFRLALMCAALYAATDETHQMFVPHRQPLVTDVLLDTCGAGLGLALVWCVLRLRKSGSP
jgi:VanZ family protein